MRIAVSGGSFPAQMWRLMMEKSIGLRPARDFPEPSAYPTYQTFHRGPLALSYDPYYVAPSTETTPADTTATDTAPAKTTATAPTPSRP